jgi:hypothetical protein
MKHLRMTFLFVGVLCFAVSAFPQKSIYIGTGAASKELKRAARRLHVPIEQLKKAQKALQEATDLARQIKPFPASEIQGLTETWRQLDRSKAKEVLDSFVQDLRTEAAGAKDFHAYQQATSTALMLLQINGGADYEKAQQIIQSWPEPPASAGEAGAKFLNGLKSSLRQSSIWNLANSDPAKAKELLSQADDSKGYNYSVSGQIVRGLIQDGKKDEALALVNQTINDFNQHASDPLALQAYQNFAQSTVSSLGSSVAGSIMTPLITQMTNQTPSNNCTSGSLKSGDSSIDLTCSEWNALTLVRNFSYNKPELVNNTLKSFPSLKSKLDQVGGIDDVSSGTGVTMSPKFPGAAMNGIPTNINGLSEEMSFSPENLLSIFNSAEGDNANLQNQSKLQRELKGKAESNPELVKGRLKEAAKGPSGITMLISLAMMSNYDDPDLGSLALEVAKSLINQVEPIEKRASILQNFIQVSRQVEGEVDPEILRNGFVLADQIREKSQKQTLSKAGPGNTKAVPSPQDMEQLDAYISSTVGGIDIDSSMIFSQVNGNMEAILGAAFPSGILNMNTLGMPSFADMQADQLETFLIAESAIDNYEKAIDFARSRKSDMLRLTCLVQIAQALTRSDF